MIVGLLCALDWLLKCVSNCVLQVKIFVVSCLFVHFCNPYNLNAKLFNSPLTPRAQHRLLRVPILVPLQLLEPSHTLFACHT